MNLSRILTTFLLLVTLFCALAGAAEKPLHIVLLVGQSNMAGRAQIEKADQAELHGALLWNVAEKKWEPAKAPYNQHSPHGKGASMQRLNPGPSFAKAYLAANPNVRLGIVCVARGGTSIEEWRKEREKPWPLYDSAAAAAKAAISEEGTLVGILWHQGESNSNPDRHKDYPEKLAILVKNFRSDLESPEVPFVFGQLGQWRKEYEDFNKMITQQPEKIEKTACVKTEGLTAFDQAHFDSVSQRKLGERYAAALQGLLKKSP